jgi:hypothetical protein
MVAANFLAIFAASLIVGSIFLTGLRIIYHDRDVAL